MYNVQCTIFNVQCLKLNVNLLKFCLKIKNFLVRNIRVLIILLISLSILIFFPGRNTRSIGENDYKGRKIQTVIIDPGHGGKDPGTIGLSGVYEKNIVLPVGLKLRDYLTKEYGDLKIILTRDKDEFIELKNRGKIANDNSGDLFVSLHCNARKNEENDKTGFEVYMLDPGKLKDAMEYTLKENRLIEFPPVNIDDVTPNLNTIYSSMLQNSFLKNEARFSDILQTEYIKGTKLESRGVFQAGFFVLVGASMPTVLIEMGYVTNKSDEEYLKSDTGQDEIAKSIYKSVRYFKFDYDFENSEF